MAIELPETVRVLAEDVEAIVETNPDIDLTAFITQAHALTNHVSEKDTSNVLSTALLVEIERLLSAHFYSLRDQLYRSKSTGGASANYQGQDGKGLESTHFGQQAVALDVSGTLASINAGNRKARIIWLGKPANTQLSHRERNGTPRF